MAKADKKAKEKHKRVYALRCYTQAHDMIISGYPVPTVAQYIQTTMKEYTDVTRTSLCMILHRYRKDLKQFEVVQEYMPRIFQTAEKRFGNKLQELERMEDMYKVLEFRLDNMTAEERMTGEINPHVERVIREMRDIIRTMHTVKMDLGLVGSRDLGTLSISAERLAGIKEKYGENAARAMADPVKRGRVLAALSAIKKAAKLRDSDGEPMEIANHMNLTVGETMTVDVDSVPDVEDDTELPDNAVDVEFEHVEDDIDERLPDVDDDIDGEDEDDDDDGPESSLPAERRRDAITEDLPSAKLQRNEVPPPAPVQPGGGAPPGPKKARIKR